MHRGMGVGDRILGVEGHWLMGRVIPRQFLDGVGEYQRFVGEQGAG